MEDGKIKSDVAMSTERQGPLSRFKVIDLTRARAGPTAARHFADWGADVVKVEMPQEGDEDLGRISAAFARLASSGPAERALAASVLEEVGRYAARRR